MLHIIKNRNGLERALRHQSKGDQLLLTHDAVYAVIDNNVTTLKDLPQEGVFVLASDADARGLLSRIKSRQVIDYQTFVELTVQHEKSLTWE